MSYIRSIFVVVLVALLSILATRFDTSHHMLASFFRNSSKMTTATLGQQTRPATSTAATSTAAASSSSALLSRNVAKKVLAIETPEGKGALVRRSIGTPALKNISPFLMLDHFTVAEGAGFPDHPHRGQTTVTYMLKGVFNHEDFTGRTGQIGPGDL
jgi:hypothetical protein